ncbi:Hypothetical protein FKW44_017650, partial [Caligus rogercresseyi]
RVFTQISTSDIHKGSLTENNIGLTVGSVFLLGFHHCRHTTSLVIRKQGKSLLTPSNFN